MLLACLLALTPVAKAQLVASFDTRTEALAACLEFSGFGCLGPPPCALSPGGPPGSYEVQRQGGGVCAIFRYQQECPDGGQFDEALGRCVVLECPPGEFVELSPQARCVGYDPAKEPKACPAVGNPVNPITGNKHQVELDYRGAAPYPLVFRRFYSSQRSSESASLRDHWRHSFQRRVERVLFRGVDTLRVVRDDGRSFAFQMQGGLWSGDPDVLFRVAERFDAQGAVIGFEVVTPHDAREVYDVGGRLLSVTRRDGLGLGVAYDASGLLSAVEGPFGRRLLVEHDGEGRLTALVDPAGGRVEYAYDALDRLVLVRYPDDTPALVGDAPVREYFYEDPAHPGALTRLRNENGADEAFWGYDARGRAVSSVRAGNTDATLISYHEDGGATVTDALGNVRTFRSTVVQAVRRLSAVEGGPCTVCGASSASATYAADGFVASRTDFNGNTSALVHDARGLEVSRTDAVGTSAERTVLTQWHPQFRVPVRITEPGQVTELTYDALGRLLTTTVIDPVTGRSRTTARAYGPDGLVASIDGPRTDVADVTEFSYDNGDLAAVTNALGQRTTVTAHDPHGRPARIVDPNGRVTELRYDPRGRLVERRVDGLSTHLVYDPVGNLVQTLLADGSELRYGYDAANRLTSIEDALGNRIEYALDPAGNRVGERVRDPAGALARTRNRIYDALGRLTADTGGEGQTTSFEYDLNGNLTAIVDAKGQRTVRDHDALDRLARSTDPAGGVTAFGYDARDNLVSVTDPRGLVTRYTHDGLDELIARASPDSGTTSWTVDQAGNPLTDTDARGITTRYRYDALDRLLEVRHPDPDEDVVYTYDTAPNGIGRLASVREHSGSRAWEYDRRGNVVAEIRTLDGHRYTTRYEYDALDRVSAIVYPSGARVAYRRDAAGRVTGVDLVRDGAAIALAEGVAHEPFGPAGALTFGNGLVEERRHDLDGRLVAIETPGVLDRSYAYDVNDNVLRIDDVASPGASQTFGYDTLDRLTQATGGYGVLGYAYDANGNRTAHSGPGGQDLYQVDSASNRLLSIAGPTAARFEYDAAGNIVESGGASLSYGDDGRLREAGTPGGPTTRYRYNADGERSIRTGPDGTTHFVFGPGGELLMEADGAGTVRREYVYRDGVLLARLDAAAGGAPGAGYDVVYDDWRADGAGGEVLARGVEATLRLEPASIVVREQGQVVYAVDTGVTVTRQTSSVFGELQELTYLLKFDGTHSTWALVQRHVASGATAVTVFANGPGPDGAPVSRNLAPDEQVSLSEPGGRTESAIRYHHVDHLGTPQALTDESGRATWLGDYLPFGAVDEAVAEDEQQVRFPGQYEDEGTLAYYNYQRYYDPSTGRYLTSDPIGLAGGINTYAYANANPVRYTDPTGFDAEAAVLALPTALAAALADTPAPGPGDIAALGILAFALALPSDTPQPNREIFQPERVPGKWVSKARADCNDNIPGNCPDDPKRRFAFGGGVDRDFGVARNIAKSNATHNLACQPKHVSCKCTGPKGEQYSGGC